MAPIQGKQLTFFGKLFAKPKKPFNERATALREKIRQRLKTNAKEMENEKEYILKNERILNSSERNAERRELEREQRSVERNQKRLAKVNNLQLKEALTRIKKSSLKRKLLVLPDKKLTNQVDKEKVVQFVKSIPLSNIINVCGESFREDWETINYRKRDILSHERKKSRSFVKSTNEYLYDLYRISQNLAERGNETQRKYGLILFVTIEELMTRIN